MTKKNCYNCINIRIFKKNLCSLDKVYIVDIQNYSCDRFQENTEKIKLEEKKQQLLVKEKSK